MLALRTLVIALALAALISPARLLADQLQEPRRLTAGASNQMMGVLSPDGQSLFFVSDRNATSEIFVQSPVEAGPRQLFDLNADLSWPRPSPDGKHLAYISTGQDALGDLCLFRTSDKSHACLSDGRSAELQPLWFASDRPGVVSRGDDLHGDYRLQRFAGLGAGAGSEIVLERNMLGPALGPRGQWLAYVDVERTAKRVGVSFANRAGRGLRIERLDRREEALQFEPELPGSTGYPAFSADGRQLLFAQYLNDTNGDGSIDGDDHSVLFRVAFDPDSGIVPGARPEQLTCASWNCRYPAPSAHGLIMTCSHQGSLDIYSLPVSGAIPENWKAERIKAELRSVRDQWSELLLLGRLWNLASAGAEQVGILKRMCLRHVELGELESAEFYARRIRHEAAEEGRSLPAERHWAEFMLQLIAHRRADRALSQGQLSDDYRLAEGRRLEELEAGLREATGDAKALAAVVAAEVAEDLGKKGQAERLVADLDPEAIRDVEVLRLVAATLERLSLLRADRQALLELHQKLSRHQAFDVLQRLVHAEAYVSELVRGLAQAERLERIKQKLGEHDQESELGLTLRVAAELFRLVDENQEEVRRALFELYKANRDVDRRRALVMATVRMASALGNEYLQYQFATSWASWLKRDHPERKFAEALFRRVVMERAYEELAEGDLPEARGYFFQTLVQTGDLEALAGFAEAWDKEGRADLAGQLAKRYARNQDDPDWAFAQAYLIARDAGARSRPEQLAQALAEIAKAGGERPRSVEIQLLWAYLLHQRHLATGSGSDAIGAHNHYLLALDLARERPRSQAVLLLNLGLLQASQGNHRIALRYFERRGRLPHVRPDGELAWRLARARSLYFVDQPARALQEAEQAAGLLSAHGGLERFRPLVLDRLALYSLLDGHAESALKHLDALAGMLAAQPPVQLVKLELRRAWASLELGKPDEALSALARVDKILEAGPIRAQDDAGSELSGVLRFDRAQYAELISGMKAVALRRQGRLAEAAEAWAERLESVQARFEASYRDEELLELARIQHHLAEIAHEQGRQLDAVQLVERGLLSSAEFNRRTGSGVNPVGLRLLQAYAELALVGEVAKEQFRWDARSLLEMDYSFMCEHRSPNWEAERSLFANYLALFDLRTRGR